MLRRFARFLGLTGLFVFSLTSGNAKTFALQKDWCQRKLHVVRHYEIAATPGQATVAMIPALIGFLGQTNWQVIKSSKFNFSEMPNSSELGSNNLGMPRHNYKLIWNSPKFKTITVEQNLDVEITWFGSLYTSAKLPYDAGTLQRYAASLGADAKEGVDPNNSDVISISKKIAGGANKAEEIVEDVCDWVNDNIEFAKGKRSMEEALKQRKGSCTPMSKLACSMLRHLGIPCEVVEAKFIERKNGHAFIEVYFPDAGWIFYDLSNWNRGFKSLDCLMAVGWAYQSGSLNQLDWTDGNFCEEKDTAPFPEKSEEAFKVIRSFPRTLDVKSVRVLDGPAPATVQIRRRSLKEMILDPSGRSML